MTCAAMWGFPPMGLGRKDSHGYLCSFYLHKLQLHGLPPPKDVVWCMFSKAMGIECISWTPCECAFNVSMGELVQWLDSFDRRATKDDNVFICLWDRKAVQLPLLFEYRDVAIFLLCNREKKRFWLTQNWNLWGTSVSSFYIPRIIFNVFWGTAEVKKQGWDQGLSADGFWEDSKKYHKTKEEAVFK